MTKAYDRKLKNESEKNFHRFEVFRDLGPARKYKDAAKILNNEISKNIQNSQKKSHKKITEAALRQNAQKWFWKERCSLYDAEKIYEDAINNEEDFKKTNQKIIDILKKGIEFLETKLESIFRNDDEYATTTQIRAISDAMYILDNINKNYRLCTGRSTDNSQLTGDMMHTVNAKVQQETKSVFEIIDSFDKELSEIDANGKSGSTKDT